MAFRVRPVPALYRDFIARITKGSILLLSLLLIFPFLVIADDQLPDPKNVHRVLEASDAQFNNAILNVATTGTEYIPNESETKSSIEKVGYRTTEKIVVRNHEVTVFSDVDEGYSSGSDYHLTPKVRWTNRDGVMKEFKTSGNDNSSVVKYLPDGASTKGGETKLWKTEMTLGFGFGGRLDQLQIVSKDKDLLKAGCTLALSDKERAECELSIDMDYIIRLAHFRVGNDKSWYEYDIETEGIVKVGEFRCAKSGKFSSVFCLSRGAKDVERTPLQKFEVVFKSLIPDLSDQQYVEATTFNVPRAAQVIDRYHIVTKPTSRRKFPWRSTVFLINVLVIMALVLLIYLNKKRVFAKSERRVI